MARFRITMTGRTPLVVHNAQLADPENEIVREIKALTSKKKKTDEDHRAIGRLEWYGGLYLDEERHVVMPTGNIRRCFIEAAKTRKLGKQFGRAVSFVDFTTPIVHEGPDDIDKLYARPEFRLRTTVVNNGQTRIVRVRPKFPSWSIATDIELLDDMMNPGEVRDIAALAGLIEGLCDYRTGGFGRFGAEVIAA